MTKEITVLREKLGLSDAEARVMIPVYLGGNVTAGGVSLLTGEKLTLTKRALARLVKKGLVREIDGIVPVYQAVPPVLGLSESLSHSVGIVEGIVEDTSRHLERRVVETEESVEALIGTQVETAEKIRKSLDSYEERILNLVQSQIEHMVSVTSGAMAVMSEEIERSLETLDSSMDNHLGAKLEELQTVLDQGQVALSKDLTKINRSFGRWLKTERKTVLLSATEFEKKSKALVKAAREAVDAALTGSSEALQSLANEIIQSLSSLASSASDEGLEVLNNISSELTEFITQLDGDLSASYISGQASLDEIITQAREVSDEYSEFARAKINAATEIAGEIGNLVDSWKEEVGGFMDVASQSVTSQLDQVAQTDANYLEMMKNSLTSHIEKVNQALSEEYAEIANLSTELGANCENTLTETRSMVLELLQKQHQADQDSCEAAANSFHSELDEWVEASVGEISKTLKSTARDVGRILDTESQEINTIAEAMSSRLTSAFSTIIKSTQTKNAALLTAVKKASHEFEAGVGSRLDEIISNFSLATEKQVKESRALYQALRDRLDKRMAKSVSNITSHSDRIQREIDKTIVEQVERIDKHAQNIKDEFHSQLQEMTKQFITLTQGLEATFNGLVSSQTVEARDLIASAHTEFKSSLKSEMLSLKEESAKLQQEYSAELGMKMEEVAATVASGKRMLDELALDKRHEIAESMAITLRDLESAVRGTEERLSEMESGTVQQFVENLSQVSQEFRDTVAGARDNIAEKMDNATLAVESTLQKSSASAKAVADGFVDSQRDLKQRFLADTSKKMNRLATKRVKHLSERIEQFRADLSERETSGVEDRNAAKREVIAAVESRRAEVVNAFDSASVLVDSTVSNVATSLDQFGTKLKNEVTLMQRGLQKAAEEAASAISERGDSDMEKLQEMATALAQNAENLVRARLNDFADKCATSLTRGNTGFNSLPAQIGTKLDRIQSEIVDTTSKQFGDVATDLSTSFNDCQRSAEATSEEIKGLIDRVSATVTEKQDEIAVEVEKSVAMANQHAFRKLESVGLELKTELSGESSRLIEEARSAFAVKNLEITDSVTKARNKISEESTLLRQSRSDTLSTFSETSEKKMKRWSSDQKAQMEALRERIASSLGDVTSTVKDTIDVLDSVSEASRRLLRTPSKRTWYLSGEEEACAHMIDMVQRAQTSIVISVPDIACLDLKKLSRGKEAKRRILILPETEDTEPLEGLDGWRIWRTRSPLLLAIRDETEILVGGATEAECPIAIVSEEESYLKLYHDILGPELIAGRVQS
ncbi:MAG: hypothetical protein ACP6KW_07580 [Candidatus Thorarchaeota archaeon]